MLFSSPTLRNAGPVTPHGCYEAVLQTLPANIPHLFREGAYLAAQYLTVLEQNAAATTTEANYPPEVNHFARSLANSCFISLAQMTSGFKRVNQFSPEWVIRFRRDSTEGKISDEEWSRITETLNHYLRQYGREDPTVNGIYYHFKGFPGTPPPSDQDLIDNYKIYIERSELSKTDHILAALEELKNENLHPRSMKFMPGQFQRFVLYWRHLTKDQLEKIERILKKHTLNHRSPAQDGVEFYKDENGDIMRLFIPNDDSIGNFYPEEIPYNPQGFFREWLRACFGGGKLPNNFYLLGFLRAALPDPDPNSSLSREFRNHIQEINTTAYPVLYVFKNGGNEDLFGDPNRWIFEGE